MTVTAVILAGGRSRRMGQDKSLMMLDGQPMLAHVIAALIPLAVPMLLVSNTPEVHAEFHLPMVGDIRPDLGALGGLHSALTHVTTESVMVVACDMPRLNSALLGYLVDLAAAHPEADAVVPRLDGRAHPLHTVYRRRALTVIESHIDRKVLALNTLLDSLTVRWADEAEMRPYDPRLESFINLNTPQDVDGLPQSIMSDEAMRLPHGVSSR